MRKTRYNPRLTEREIEVVELLSKGYTRKQIAKELVIQLSTTSSHIDAIYDKLDAHNPVQAANKFREEYTNACK